MEKLYKIKQANMRLVFVSNLITRLVGMKRFQMTLKISGIVFSNFVATFHMFIINAPLHKLLPLNYRIMGYQQPF